MDAKQFREFIEDFKTADTDRLEALMGNLDNMTPEQKKEFEPVLNERMRSAISNAKNVISHVRLANKMENMTDYLSISYISKRFFGKSRSWLHNRLKGNNNNGKPAVLTPLEEKQLKSALYTLSNEIKIAADQI